MVSDYEKITCSRRLRLNSCPPELYIGIDLVFGGIALGLLIGWLLGRASAVAPVRIRGWKTNCASKSPSAKRNWPNCAASSPKPAMPAPRRKPARPRRRRWLAEQRALQDKALADLREAFKALSAEALKQSAPEFLRLAEQTFGKFQETAKGDLAQRQESIKTLVEPLKQQLETYQKRLQQSETSQAATLGEVKKQLETLAQSKPVARAGNAAVPDGADTQTRRAGAGARKRCGASSRRRA